MPSSRRIDNWLRGIAQLTEVTEAPAEFWLWGGLFTLSSAMGARCRLRYGIDPLFPNLYLCLVASPGRARKGGIPSLAKRMLGQIQGQVCNLGVDSTTKASLTQELAFYCNPVQIEPGRFEAVSELVLISKELSSLLGPDLKNMIEVLTDLFDYHSEWEYKTKNKGKDKLRQPCLNFMAATTPTWLATNVPYESIGYGWGSRMLFIVAKNKKRRITFPKMDYEGRLFKDLISDLSHIAGLRGEFSWEEKAMEFFDEWYQRLDNKYKEISDDRFHDMVERLHIQVLKVAMCLSVAYSDDLILRTDDIGRAIDLVDSLLPLLPDAFGSLGKNRLSPEIDRMMRLFEERGAMTEGQILSIMWRNLQPQEVKGILESFLTMGIVKVDKVEFKEGQMNRTFKWLGEKGKKR